MAIGFFIFRGSNLWKSYGVFLTRWCMVKHEFKHKIMFCKINLFLLLPFTKKKKDYSAIVFLSLVSAIVSFCRVSLKMCIHIIKDQLFWSESAHCLSVVNYFFYFHILQNLFTNYKIYLGIVKNKDRLLLSLKTIIKNQIFNNCCQEPN